MHKGPYNNSDHDTYDKAKFHSVCKMQWTIYWTWWLTNMKNTTGPGKLLLTHNINWQKSSIKIKGISLVQIIPTQFIDIIGNTVLHTELLLVSKILVLNIWINIIIIIIDKWVYK